MYIGYSCMWCICTCDICVCCAYTCEDTFFFLSLVQGLLLAWNWLKHVGWPGSSSYFYFTSTGITSTTIMPRLFSVGLEGIKCRPRTWKENTLSTPAPIFNPLLPAQGLVLKTRSLSLPHVFEEACHAGQTGFELTV